MDMGLSEDAKIVDEDSLAEAGYSLLVVGIVMAGLIAAFTWNTGEVLPNLLPSILESMIVQGMTLLTLSTVLMIVFSRK